MLFVSPRMHSKGVGFAAWCAVERMHPEVTLWETVTPYFERRNIPFYVNRCGFHIVEFYNNHHPDPGDPDTVLTEMSAERIKQLRFGKIDFSSHYPIILLVLLKLRQIKR